MFKRFFSSAPQRRRLFEYLKTLSFNPSIKQLCKENGITGNFYSQTTTLFRNHVTDNDAMVKQMIDRMQAEDLNSFVPNLVLEFAKKNAPNESFASFEDLREMADLRSPTKWFPETRMIKRKVIMHVGPTNSGKTHAALQKLKQEGGLYCGPLRLLAAEIYERMNSEGIDCNLMTGEEQKHDFVEPKVVSCTVEMADITRPIKVAVLDEIQMIADVGRGWAWTRAFLGVKAEEIHLCGEETSVPLVKKLCKEMNETLVINTYGRLSPLHVMDRSLNGTLKNVRKGDCVVTFSRKSIYLCKEFIEKHTPLRCAIIYGKLPPEIRSKQAQHFNNPYSGYDVLVASDAVGMGLNLNIRRIVFETFHKFDGKDLMELSVSQAKQIAGRAGRFSSDHKHGEVTALNTKALKLVHKALRAPNQELTVAGLMPSDQVMEMFSRQFTGLRFSQILEKFEDLAQVSGDYFLCNWGVQKEIARMIDFMNPLTVSDRYLFTNAPINVRAIPVREAFLKFVSSHCKGETVEIKKILILPETVPATSQQMMELEQIHSIIMLYLYLSFRLPCTFSKRNDAMELKAECEKLINAGLASMTLRKKKRYRREEELEDIPQVLQDFIIDSKQGGFQKREEIKNEKAGKLLNKLVEYEG